MLMIGGDSRSMSAMFVSELGEWAENMYDKSANPSLSSWTRRYG